MAIAVAIAGAGIGSAFGSAALGWAIGTVIGQSLFSETQKFEGPRLGDLSVQSSSYGAHIPKIYGAYRAAGNIIDSTDIKETKHTEKSGGKGGGAGKSEQTTYTYSVDCAVGICEGEIDSIRKIWADGKLIYDVDVTNVVGDGGGGGIFASAISSLSQKLFVSSGFTRAFIVYTGTETQTPDPLFESLAGGDGEYPAYRGLAYVVFQSFQLADFGNRIPNFTFEVLTSTTAGGIIETIYNENLVDVPCGAVGGTSLTGAGAGYGGEITEGVMTINQGSGGLLSAFAKTFYYSINIDVAGNFLGFGSPTVLWERGNTSQSPVGFQGASLMAGRVGGHWIFLESTAAHNGVITGSLQNTPVIIGGARYGGIRITEDYIIGDQWGPFSITLEPTGHRVYGFCTSPDGSAMYTIGLDYIDDVADQGYIKEYDSSLELVGAYPVDTDGGANDIVDTDHTTNGAGITSGVFGSVWGIESDQKHIWFINGEQPQVYLLDKDSTSTTNRLTLLEELPQNTVIEATHKYLLCDHGSCFVIGDNSSGSCPDPLTDPPSGSAANQAETYQSTVTLSLNGYSRIGVVSGTSEIPLGDIVSDIILSDTRLTSADIDVTDLAGITVEGYSRTGVMPMRRALEPLQQTYFFDIIESGFKFKAVLRGAQPVTDIAIEKFGAGIEQPADALLVKTQTEDLELPHRLYVTYLTSSRDYQQASQNSERLQTQSIGVTDTQIPIVITDNKAAQVADVLITEAYARADSFQFSLSNEYYGIEPGDVIRTTWNDVERLLRIESTSRQNGIIECVASREILTSYENPRVGGSADQSQSIIVFAGGSLFVEADLPTLSKSGDTLGLYYGVRGSGTRWAGANIFKSDDSQSGYVSVDTALTEIITGRVSAIHNGVVAGVIDPHNDIVVKMSSGQSLETASSEDNFLSGAENLAAYGFDGAWEIISFRTATLTDADTNEYTLSNIVRGRRGTSAAVTAHSGNETFILLTFETVNFLLLDYSDIDQDRFYKTVSFGGVIQEANSISATYSARNLQTIAPTFIGQSQDASLNNKIVFNREDRNEFDLPDVSGQNISELDANGDPVEIYSIDVIDVSASDAVLNTYDSSEDATNFTFYYSTNDFRPSFTYTAANQTADGAVSGDLLRIYHISQNLRDNTAGDGRSPEYLEVELI